MDGAAGDLAFKGAGLTIALRLPVKKGDVLTISKPLTKRFSTFALADDTYFTEGEQAVGNFTDFPVQEIPVAGTLTIIQTSPPVIDYDLTATDEEGNSYAFTGTFRITKGSVVNPECD